MPPGDLVVRQDWRAIEAREQAQRGARKASLQIALVSYGLLALGLSGWRAAAAWAPLAQSALFALAFLWTPLRVSLPADPRGRRTLLVAGAALAGMALLAALTVPTPALAHASFLAGRLLPGLSLLIPAAMIALLLWATARHPGLSHALGLTARAWGYQVAVGLCLGLALGLHLWVVVAAVPGEGLPRLAPPATLVWLVATGAGLVSLGEELALRGALFTMLTTEARGLRPALFLRTIALAAPLYLAPVVHSGYVTHLPIALFYGALFTVLALLLRFSFRSIAAPLAANLAFHTLLVLATLA